MIHKIPSEELMYKLLEFQRRREKERGRKLI